MSEDYCSEKTIRVRTDHHNKKKFYFPPLVLKNRRSFNRVRLDERNRFPVYTDEDG
jgi:hypothetical protein